MMNKWRWKREKFLEHVISQEQISVGLNGVDNNLRWEKNRGMWSSFVVSTSVEMIVVLCWRVSLTLSCCNPIDMKRHYNRLRRWLRFHFWRTRTRVDQWHILGNSVPLNSKRIHLGTPDCRDGIRNYKGWQSSSVHLEYYIFTSSAK